MTTAHKTLSPDSVGRHAEGVACEPEVWTHQLLDEFRLLYHREVARRLRTDACGEILDIARANLDFWMTGEVFSAGELASLQEWRDLLDRAPLDRLIEIITEESEEGDRLRQSSPFAAVIPAGARERLLDECEKRAIDRLSHPDSAATVNYTLWGALASGL